MTTNCWKIFKHVSKNLCSYCEKFMENKYSGTKQEKYNSDLCECVVKHYGKFTVECNMCNKPYEYNAQTSTTTTLNNHYNFHYPNSSQQPSTTIIDSFSKLNDDALHTHILEFFISQDISFTAIDNYYFKRFDSIRHTSFEKK